MSQLTGIKKASLYFIVPLDYLLDLDGYEDLDDDFLSLLEHVQQDEFTETFYQHIKRELFYKQKVKYLDYELDCKIFLANFNTYSSSLVYIQLNIDEEKMGWDDFVNLINSQNVVHRCWIGNQTIRDYLSQHGIELAHRSLFLFNQIIETIPAMPSTYEKGMAFVREHKQQFHQLLLRSDTYHEHLRGDNHQENFESISNFYGTIDFCSPVTLIQLFQYPICSVGDKNLVIDASYRACWWLTITDVIFIQKTILSTILKSIDKIQTNSDRGAIKRLGELERILLSMNSFWYFEDMTHEITKKVVNKVKSRMGIDHLLEKIEKRIQTVENATLREINEEQNYQNGVLNIILLVVTLMQIIPFIYDVIAYFYDPKTHITLKNIMMWLQTLGLIIFIPLLYIKKIQSIKKNKPLDK